MKIEVIKVIYCKFLRNSPDMGIIGNLNRLHKWIEKKYKSSDLFYSRKIFNFLFDVRRRPPVDLYEKILDFLVVFGLLKKVVNNAKKIFLVGEP
jgi:hypothetical protein